MPNGCSNDVLRPRVGRKKKPVFVFRTSNIVESDLLYGEKEFPDGVW